MCAIHLPQGRWHDESSLLTLPRMDAAGAARLAAAGLAQLPQLLQALHAGGSQRAAAVKAVEGAVGGTREARDVLEVCERLPVVGLTWQAPQLVQQQQLQQGGDGAGPSYRLEVELRRLGGKGGSRQSPPRVYAPRYPKVRSCQRLGRAGGRKRLTGGPAGGDAMPQTCCRPSLPARAARC